MSLPVRHLPVLQNWDCHGCTNCCRDYHVPVTEAERQRIVAQGWEKDPDVGDLPLFIRYGPPWRRRYRLNARGNGNCIFLTEQGRCRIHERFGGGTKPLACRLFPFVLVAADDHWRVSLRYACPSVAANRGRLLSEHDAALARFAAELEAQRGVDAGPRSPPPMQSGQRVDWPDLFRFVQALLAILRDRRDRVERRLRKCLTLVQLCRQARFDRVTSGRLVEFLNLIAAGLDEDVPADPTTVSPPSWVGRILFRQVLAIYLRKDHGPDRGIAAQGRVALLRAAWRFARGQGPVPRLHGRLPETTFERLEDPAGLLPEAAEETLERYYVTKLGSLQFCGPTNFGLSFWDGFESLALMLPLILWLSRAFTGLPREEAVVRAVNILDDHFGFNPILGTRRQRFSLNILARTGELPKLIAWYSR